MKTKNFLVLIVLAVIAAVLCNNLFSPHLLADTTACGSGTCICKCAGSYSCSCTSGSGSCECMCESDNGGGSWMECSPTESEQ